MIFLQLSDDGKRQFDARVPVGIITRWECGRPGRRHRCFEGEVRPFGAHFAPLEDDKPGNYFLPSSRMREVKARPVQAVKVGAGWVAGSMMLLTTKGSHRPVMLSKPPRRAR